MSKCVNKVTILGHLGKDPEVKSLSNGESVANFSVATTYRIKVNGDWVDRTEWHNVAAFGRSAEIARDYLKKGSKLYVEGRLATRSWDDKDTKKKVYRTEIIINNLVLLSARDNAEEATSQGAGESRTSPGSRVPAEWDAALAECELNDDDIPF